jgi:hypothetical protein
VEIPYHAYRILFELTTLIPDLEDTYAIVTTSINDDYITYNYHNDFILDCETSTSKTELDDILNNRDNALKHYGMLIEFLVKNKIDYEFDFWLHILK